LELIGTWASLKNILTFCKSENFILFLSVFLMFFQKVGTIPELFRLRVLEVKLPEVKRLTSEAGFRKRKISEATDAKAKP